jgi:hypothetical protein
VQFGVGILFSGDFLSMLSPKVASKCRAIDRYARESDNERRGCQRYDQPKPVL